MRDVDYNQSTDCYRIEYYNSLIEKHLTLIGAAAKGTGADFLPYVTDDDGKYSYEKLKLFTDKLISLSKYPLHPREKELYEAFFFCAIYCFANDRIKDIGGAYREYKRCSQFYELIERASLFSKDADWYDSYKRLLYEEFCDYSEDKPFNQIGSAYTIDPGRYSCHTFLATLDCYYLFCFGGSIEDLDYEGFNACKEEFLLKEKENYDISLSLVPDEEIWEGSSFDEGEDLDELYDIPESDIPCEVYALAADGPDEPLMIEAVLEGKNSEKLSWEEVGRYLPDRDMFLYYYRRLRTLFFDGFHIDAEKVEYMILQFMGNEGIGSLCDNAIFTKVLHDLERCNCSIGRAVNRRS